ncbi:hypothetical protein GCM10025856_26380 [Methylophaga marina]|uniref:Uncharacterized protein n=1 Tax=Methylophaga marina TaxID=45495 RepID=A0ABN0U1C5_9GAMM|nr:hypothetical protein GCM10025856_26380 [Methylophaga marina]
MHFCKADILLYTIDMLYDSLAYHAKKQLKKHSNSDVYVNRDVKGKIFLLTSPQFTVECAPLADEEAFRG